MANIGKVNTYHIQFDTEKKGISGTRIDIGRFFEKDPNAKFNVALCDDPLYPVLVDYVNNNNNKQRSIVKEGLKLLYKQYLAMTGDNPTMPFSQATYDRLVLGLIKNAEELLK